MKVKIFTEVGESIGYGHLYRCVSLYEEIQKRRVEAELIIHGKLENISILKNKTVTYHNWINLEYLNKTLLSEDYVIVDSYIAQREHYELIASRSKKTLYIDDLGRIKYPEGIIVNPAFDSNNIDYSYMVTEKVLTGAKYVILRSNFAEVINSMQKREINNTVSKVLVIMGGTDVRNMTSVIIDNISKQSAGIIFDIVLNAAQYEKLSSIIKLNNINFHKNLSGIEMNQVMLETDLAITAAGQTIYELIATKTPFIAIQIAENQQNNIKSLEKHISPKIVLRYDEANFVKKIQDQFLKMNHYNVRNSIVEKMTGLIDGYGAARIIDALLNQIAVNNEIYLREVHSGDLKDIFELSNKDYVRQYSLSKDKILWDRHVEWFNKTLQDKLTVFYIVTNKNNSFLGQVRYRLEEDNATVSISLSEKIKGKGLSKIILKLSIAKLFEEKTNVNKIIAYVSENNIASMKLFSGLNFKATKEEGDMLKLILRRDA